MPSRNTFVTGLMLCGALLMSSATAGHPDIPPQIDAWLQEHQIGPYQEDVTDLDAIYEAARQEGRVVVYASSSRGPAAIAEGFSERYPDIEVEWNTIGTSDTIERLIREQQAGIHNVDIIFVSDMATQTNVLHPANMLFPWVPSDLRDVIPLEFREPLAAHRYEARVLFFNDEAYETVPIESWWDLTRPEWNRLIVLEDPRTSGSTLDLFTTFVLNADEMADDYERVFGEPIELTTPNAGYEFIRRLAANQPRLIPRDSDGRFIAERGQDNPPLGMSFAFSRIRDAGDPALGDITWTVATELTPRAGLLYPSGINIAANAPHPNAAKLLVAWLHGDEQGGGGMTPWFVPGNWPARMDVTATPDHPFRDGHSWSVDEITWWYMDPAGIWSEQENVLQFVQEHF
jgi:iron(III) transport system substrate-binding protein